MAGYSQITSGGQSGLVAGGVIQHTLFTEEFTAIVNAFNATTGHSHDGTAGEGGIITTLRSNPLTFGAVDTSDVVITFEGGSGNDGVLTWDQSADKFIFADTVRVAGNLEVTGTADFGESNFTNVGSIALDSITGDGDADTSIAFSGSDVITIKTNDATRAIINNTGIDVTGEIKGDSLDIDGAADISGDLTLSAGGDGALTFANGGENSIKIPDNQTSALIVEEADNPYMTFRTTNGQERIIASKNLHVDVGSGDSEGIIHSSTGSARLFIDTDATGGSKHASIELGGTDGSFIDIKKPASDDYDLRIQHFSDAKSVIKSATGDMIIQAETNGTAVKLQHEGENTKLETTDTGVDVTGTITADGLTMLDSEKITLGTGGDLEIYHNGNHSYILEAGTGDLRLGADELKIVNSNNSETKAVFTTNGSVELYNDHSKKFETTDTGIDVTGEVKGDSLDIDGNAAITGTVTIDPPLVTGLTEGLGAKGIIMKQGDLRMKVDGDYDSSNTDNSKGTSLQNNSRIIFDSEQHEHIQHETLGFRNPAFVIQANYDHSAGYGAGGAGTEYLNANISQLGNGDLNISSGKLQLRGKVNHDDGGDGDAASGDDYFDHDSYMGITIDGSTTQGTVTRMHYGFINDNTKNIRLEPSVSGIIVGGDGDATGSGTTDRTDPATIGVNADIDLLTLENQKLTIKGDTTAGGIGDSDHALVVEGAVTIKGTNDGGQLIIENSGTSGSDNPDIVLFNNNTDNSSQGQDGDKLGGVHFYGKDGGGNTTNFGVFAAEIVTAAHGGTEASKFVFRPRTADAVSTDIVTIDGSGLDVTGAVTADTATFSSGELSNNLVVASTSDNTSASPDITFEKNSSIAPVATQKIGNILFKAPDANNNATNVTYGKIQVEVTAVDASAGTHSGQIDFYPRSEATSTANNETVSMKVGSTDFATDINVTGTVTADGLTLGDSEYIKIGEGNGSGTPDLQIFSNGTNAFIEQPSGSGTTNLIIRGQNINLRNDADATLISTDNDQVRMWTQVAGAEDSTNGAAKFSTTTAGIDVNGTITTDQIHVDAQVLDTNDAGSEVTAAEMATYVGQTITFVASTGTTARTVTLPDAVTADVGKRWVICNAATANITIALNSQKLNILSGASVVNCGSDNPHIVAGGVAEIICVAGGTGTDAQPNYIIFGSGVVDN